LAPNPQNPTDRGPRTVFKSMRLQGVAGVSLSHPYFEPAFHGTYRHISERSVLEDEANEIVHATDPISIGDERT